MAEPEKREQKWFSVEGLFVSFSCSNNTHHVLLLRIVQHTHMHTHISHAVSHHVRYTRRPTDMI